MRQFIAVSSFLVALGLVRCVSRTVPEDRYEASRAMASPRVSAALADPENFSFAIVGDTHIAGGDTSRFRRILAAAIGENDAFIICLGDIVDQGDRGDFVAFRDALTSVGWADRVLSVIGNHDVFSDGWTHFQELNGPSHYSVTIGNSRFIAIDTADGTVSPSEHEWLETELEKAAPRHTFLLSHYLPVVPGQRTYLKLANENEALRLMKLATRKGIKGWFGGHYHSFVTEEIDSVAYVGAGGGGGRRMEPVKDYFFVQVKVSASEVTYQLRVVP